MGQKVRPDQWERDVQRAERRIGARRGAERRRMDRWGRIFDRVALLVLVGLYLFGFQTIKEDRQAGRSQTCLAFEQTHKQEVDQLANTYRFLLSDPREKWDSTQRFAYAQLVTIERDAASDQDKFGQFVPSYCDKPGYGRDEPDPKVPKRPKGLK